MILAAPAAPRPVAELAIQRPAGADGTRPVATRIPLTLDRETVVGTPGGYRTAVAAFDAAWYLSQPAGVHALAVVQGADGMFQLRRVLVDSRQPLRLEELLRGAGDRSVRLRLTHPSVLAIVDSPAYTSRW